MSIKEIFEWEEGKKRLGTAFIPKNAGKLIGRKFKVSYTSQSSTYYKLSDVLEFIEDDGSEDPYFKHLGDYPKNQEVYVPWYDLEPIYNDIKEI